MTRPDLALVGVVLGAGADGDLHQLVLGRGGLVERDETLAIEGPERDAGAAEVAVVLLEDLPDLGDGAVPVVGRALDEEERAVGAGALVEDLFVALAFDLAGAALDGVLDRVAGHRLPLGVGDRLAQARVVRGIAAAHAGRDGELLDQLGEELAALGVSAPFLRLIVAHLEWPLMLTP